MVYLAVGKKDASSTLIQVAIQALEIVQTAQRASCSSSRNGVPPLRAAGRGGGLRRRHRPTAPDGSSPEFGSGSWHSNSNLDTIVGGRNDEENDEEHESGDIVAVLIAILKDDYGSVIEGSDNDSSDEDDDGSRANGGRAAFPSDDSLMFDASVDLSGSVSSFNKKSNTKQAREQRAEARREQAVLKLTKMLGLAQHFPGDEQTTKNIGALLQLSIRFVLQLQLQTEENENALRAMYGLAFSTDRKQAEKHLDAVQTLYGTANKLYLDTINAEAKRTVEYLQQSSSSGSAKATTTTAKKTMSWIQDPRRKERERVLSTSASTSGSKSARGPDSTNSSGASSSDTKRNDASVNLGRWIGLQRIRLAVFCGAEIGNNSNCDPSDDDLLKCCHPCSNDAHPLEEYVAASIGNHSLRAFPQLLRLVHVLGRVALSGHDPFSEENDVASTSTFCDDSSASAFMSVSSVALSHLRLVLTKMLFSALPHLGSGNGLFPFMDSIIKDPSLLTSFGLSKSIQAISEKVQEAKSSASFTLTFFTDGFVAWPFGTKMDREGYDLCNITNIAQKLLGHLCLPKRPGCGITRRQLLHDLLSALLLPSGASPMHRALLDAFVDVLVPRAITFPHVALSAMHNDNGAAPANANNALNACEDIHSVAKSAHLTPAQLHVAKDPSQLLQGDLIGQFLLRVGLGLPWNRSDPGFAKLTSKLLSFCGGIRGQESIEKALVAAWKEGSRRKKEATKPPTAAHEQPPQPQNAQKSPMESNDNDDDDNDRKTTETNEGNDVDATAETPESATAATTSVIGDIYQPIPEPEEHVDDIEEDFEISRNFFFSDLCNFFIYRCDYRFFVASKQRKNTSSSDSIAENLNDTVTILKDRHSNDYKGLHIVAALSKKLIAPSFRSLFKELMAFVVFGLNIVEAAAPAVEKEGEEGKEEEREATNEPVPNADNSAEATKKEDTPGSTASTATPTTASADHTQRKKRFIPLQFKPMAIKAALESRFNLPTQLSDMFIDLLYVFHCRTSAARVRSSYKAYYHTQLDDLSSEDREAAIANGVKPIPLYTILGDLVLPPKTSPTAKKGAGQTPTTPPLSSNGLKFLLRQVAAMCLRGDVHHILDPFIAHLHFVMERGTIDNQCIQNPPKAVSAANKAMLTEVRRMFHYSTSLVQQCDYMLHDAGAEQKYSSSDEMDKQQQQAERDVGEEDSLRGMNQEVQELFRNPVLHIMRQVLDTKDVVEHEVGNIVAAAPGVDVGVGGVGGTVVLNVLEDHDGNGGLSTTDKILRDEKVKVLTGVASGVLFLLRNNLRAARRILASNVFPSTPEGKLSAHIIPAVTRILLSRGAGFANPAGILRVFVDLLEPVIGLLAAKSIERHKRLHPHESEEEAAKYRDPIIVIHHLFPCVKDVLIHDHSASGGWPTRQKIIDCVTAAAAIPQTDSPAAEIITLVEMVERVSELLEGYDGSVDPQDVFPALVEEVSTAIIAQLKLVDEAQRKHFNEAMEFMKKVGQTKPETRVAVILDALMKVLETAKRVEATPSTPTETAIDKLEQKVSDAAKQAQTAADAMGVVTTTTFAPANSDVLQRVNLVMRIASGDYKELPELLSLSGLSVDSVKIDHLITIVSILSTLSQNSSLAIANAVTDNFVDSFIAHVFEIFDDEGHGKISYSAFQSILRRVHLELPQSEVRMMFAAADRDDSGFIDKWEFKRLLEDMQSKFYEQTMRMLHLTDTEITIAVMLLILAQIFFFGFILVGVVVLGSGTSDINTVVTGLLPFLGSALGTITSSDSIEQLTEFGNKAVATLFEHVRKS